MLEQWKINQSLMKSNSCNWILIENSLPELWLNFRSSFSYSRLKKWDSTIEISCLLIRVKTNEKKEVSRKFVDYIVPHSDVVFLVEWKWRCMRQRKGSWGDGDAKKTTQDSVKFSRSKLETWSLFSFQFSAPNLIHFSLANICFAFKSDIVC